MMAAVAAISISATGNAFCRATQFAVRWLSGRSLPILLILAVCLPLAGLVVVAVTTWREAWREADSEVRQTVGAASEYAARLLDSHRQVGLRANDFLRGRSDREIRLQEHQLHEVLRQMVREVSSPPTVAIFDGAGGLLVAPQVYPVPRNVSVADRSYFITLAAPDAPEFIVSPIVVGRVTGREQTSISFRRQGAGNGLPAGSFDGVVSVVIYLDEIAPGLARLLTKADDGIFLTLADGALLASAGLGTTPLATRRVSAAVGAALAQAALKGRDFHNSVLLPPDQDKPARLIAIRPVAGWPVFVVASRPASQVIAGWQALMLRHLLIGLPSIALLAGLALLVWRRQGALRLAHGTLADQVRERTAELAGSEAEFRAIFESSASGKSQADPDTLRLTRVNARFCAITGYSEAELTGGMTIPDLLVPEDRLVEVAMRRQALAAHGHYETEKRYLRPDGSIVWVHVSVAVIPAVAGYPLRTIASVYDISDRKAADERQNLLAREVDHRAKNALAVVQAALRLTPRTDAESFARTIQGRVGALARAQTLLANSQWRGTDLRALVRAELDSFLTGGRAAAQVTLAGKPVAIPAQMSQALSLALHELATNATEHGALSVSGGHLTINWLVADGRLWLEWCEQGGPDMAAPPERTGFGTRLLDSTIRHQLGGSIQHQWLPAGLRCVVEVPLGRVKQDA